jgi:O-antigen ligase
MNNSTALRSLAIYGVCLPIAIFLGYMLAGPLTWTSLGTVVIIFSILLLPFLLRFHHPLLILGWNASITAFFLPGAPKIWLPLMAISLTVSIARRTMDRTFRFISVPELTWPLIAIALIVIATAQATGGIGLRSMGGGVYGGKRYIFLLGAIVGYFALTAHRILPKHRNLYITFFLLGGITTVVGDLFYANSPTLQYLFLLFPPNSYAQETKAGMVRFAGIYGTATVLYYFMLVKYGIRGLFTLNRPWRLLFFLAVTFASLMGGFRSAFVTIVLVFSLQFYLEGLHKTGLLPALVLGVILASAVVFPFVKHFPISIQRTLSFLPIEVDSVARMDAESSTDWRLEIWKAVLPQVPKYLLLGKGLGMKAEDYDFTISHVTGAMQAFSEDQSWAALASDYHSGPLSLVIPFGIWGVLAFLWLIVAGCRVLYKNYRYGDSDLRIANSYLLAAFIVKIIVFFFIFGGFYGDMHAFVGVLGMSVALNGGVAQRSTEPVEKRVETQGFHTLLPAPRRLSA